MKKRESPTPRSREVAQNVLVYLGLDYASAELALLLRNLKCESGTSFVAGATAHLNQLDLILSRLQVYHQAAHLVRLPEMRSEIRACLDVISNVVNTLTHQVAVPLREAALANDEASEEAIQAATEPVAQLRELAEATLIGHLDFLLAAYQHVKDR